MTESALATEFLPAEKAPAREVERQSGMLVRASVVFQVFDGMLNFCLVLNRQRQAVFINKAFLDFLYDHGVRSPIGLRPGTLFGCMHAGADDRDCGTTNFCRRCGSAMALGEALRNSPAVNECRILSRKSGEDLDLRVSVQPFNYNGEDFLLMSVMDISAEKRRAVLERFLFQDILNSAGDVRGLVEAAAGSGSAAAGSYAAASRASASLLDEILSQKDLAEAERGTLLLRVIEVPVAGLLNEIAEASREHEAARDKAIVVAGESGEAKLFTDRALLARVLGHMVRNALEAEKAGSTVTLSFRGIEKGGVFRVHNPQNMPEEVRLQVFQRSFSTKGPGRGTGTYAIRLLTEKYLSGKVSFSTGPEGTEFQAAYPEDIQANAVQQPA